MSLHLLKDSTESTFLEVYLTCQRCAGSLSPSALGLLQIAHHQRDKRRVPVRTHFSLHACTTACLLSAASSASCGCPERTGWYGPQLCSQCRHVVRFHMYLCILHVLSKTSQALSYAL